VADSLRGFAIRPAINTSPLIFLTKGGFLHLLQIVSPEIIVPQAVATEIQAYEQTDVTAMALAATSWLLEVVTPPVPPIIQSWDLGPGESAVLTWAYINTGTEVILDDLAARRCAVALGIPVRGTLGIVLTAKQRGAIPAARPVLEQLRLCGMYLSDRVMNQALALVGE
jgi:predicted nucleic acid-binding protein